MFVFDSDKVQYHKNKIHAQFRKAGDHSFHKWTLPYDKNKLSGTLSILPLRPLNDSKVSALKKFGSRYVPDEFLTQDQENVETVRDRFLDDLSLGKSVKPSKSVRSIRVNEEKDAFMKRTKKNSGLIEINSNVE